MRTTRRGSEKEEEEEQQQQHYHHHHYHHNNRKQNKQSHQRRDSRICKALCCSSNTRFSISSSSSSEESSERNLKLSGQHGSLSSLTHYMVQEKLEQMIRERQEAIHRENIARSMRRKRRTRSEGGSSSTTKFIVMMAMEICSYDPREDFRDSMIEMIVVNQIHRAEELRCLLQYYLSMNSLEHKSTILEIFYEVCTHLFLSSSNHYV